MPKVQVQYTGHEWECPECGCLNVRHDIEPVSDGEQDTCDNCDITVRKVN